MTPAGSQHPLAPADRYRALLESTDPEAAVDALGQLEYCQLVLALGRDDAVELLALCSPPQLRALIDIEAWRGDRLDHDRLLDWLQPFQEAGPGRLARAFLSLDAEVAALLLLEDLRIYLAEEDDDPGEEHELLPTPDRRVFFEILVDDEERAGQLRALLDAMFRWDPAASVHALLEMRAALPAEIEEQAYRWRCARLEDLGFPGLEEALGVYARPAGGAASTGWTAAGRSEALARVPVLYAEPLQSGVLAEALQAAPVERRDELTAALVLLFNQVLVADRVELADPRGIRASALAARSLLQLGLARLGADTAQAAAAVLLERGPQEVFRSGYALVGELARRTHELARAGLLAGEPAGELIDTPGREVLAALVSGARPRYSCLLDDPPAQGQRPFAALDDVARVEAALDRAEAAARLVHERLGMPARAIRSLAAECDKQPLLGNAFRTAVVRRALGAESFEVDLLDADELNRFRDRAVAAGEPPALAGELAGPLEAGLAGLVAELPEALQPPARAQAQAWIAAMVEELGSLPRGEPVDPRFVGGFFVKA